MGIRDGFGFLAHIYEWLPGKTKEDSIPLIEIKGENSEGTAVNGLKVNDDGSINTKQTGSKLEEQLTQADAEDNVLTFSENISTIEIYHGETTWQQFTVNGIALNIPQGGYRTPVGGTPSSEVTIPAGVNCIVGRLV